MNNNFIQKFSEIFSHSDRQSSSRSPEKKSRLEINETFTIDQSTVPLGQPLSFPPTAGDIEAYEAATLAHRARTCLLYTSPSPRDRTRDRMPSSA